MQPAVTRVGDDLVVVENRPVAGGAYEIVARVLHAGAFGAARSLGTIAGFVGYPGAADLLPSGAATVPCFFGWTRDASVGDGHLVLVQPSTTP